MSRFLPWLIAALALAVAACAAEPVTPEQRVKVNAILATVKADNPPSELVAEDALVKEGKALLPAMAAILLEKRGDFHQADMPLRHLVESFDSGHLTAQITALDQAIFRLASGVNPRQRIIEWAHALKFADDGRAFTREFLPLPVLDIETDRLQRVFPAYRFYFVYLPGYLGGAAPPEEIVRALLVPDPLRVINLFAVDKAGHVSLMTRAVEGLQEVDRTVVGIPGDIGALEALFSDILPPVKTADAAKDAVGAWLRLTTSFWLWSNQPLAFSPIADADLTAAPGAVWSFVAMGVVRVAPLNNNKGQITALLSFDAAGKLGMVMETPQLELSLAPQPCSAPPPAGGPRGGGPAPLAAE